LDGEQECRWQLGDAYQPMVKTISPTPMCAMADLAIVSRGLRLLRLRAEARPTTGAVYGDSDARASPQRDRHPPSARLDDSKAQLPGGGDHPVVVRDERPEFVAELVCRREVNRVEGAKLERAQHTCCIQDAIIHTNQVESLKHAATSSHRLVAGVKEGAQHFGARERTRDQWLSSPEIAAKRERL
jgi:hypothetical protein